MRNKYCARVGAWGVKVRCFVRRIFNRKDAKTLRGAEDVWSDSVHCGRNLTARAQRRKGGAEEATKDLKLSAKPFG